MRSAGAMGALTLAWLVQLGELLALERRMKRM